MSHDQVLSPEFLASVVHTSFGDFEYEDGEYIVVRRGDRLPMPTPHVSEGSPLKRFMRPNSPKRQP